MNWKVWPCWVKIVIAVGIVIFVLNWPKSSSDWASWIQAIGSIGAILGAIWISNRDRNEQIAEANRKEASLQEQVGFEVANLAYDVTQFLCRTSSADSTKTQRYLVDEAEFNELLERMAWVRRTAIHSIDLEDARTLRSNLVETTALLRVNAEWKRSIPKEETDYMEKWQAECAAISNRRSTERGKHFSGV